MNYNLGEHFRFDLNVAKANKDSIILGQKYRFTIITESLVRLEYSETGKFEDNPSELAWYRNFPKPEFYVQSDDKFIQVKTRNFTLMYQKNAPFKSFPINPSSNLSITANETGKVWYYKHPEVRNYDSLAGEFDEKNELKKIKGLYSTDGFASIDDSNTMVFEGDGTLRKRQSNSIDIYVFIYGNLFYKGLNDYYKITGNPSFIPRYALGTWWFKDDDYNDYTLSNLLNDFQNKKVPISLITLNNSWHLGKFNNFVTKTGFTFDSSAFKNPNKMINYFHEKKIKIGLTLNLSDGIRNFEQYYQTALQYIKPDKNGVIPFNVYDNTFLDIYFKIFVHSLTNYDIDFFRIDHVENQEVRFFLNHYHTLDAKVINNRRSLLITHDSYVAPHRYPVITTGFAKVDWDSLIKMCEYNIGLANRGISWATHTYGGFYKGIEESELYLRFIQLGVFSPIFSLASAAGKYYKRFPWEWDYHTFVIAREFINFRQKLVPYLYTEGYRFCSDGLPLIEPIYYRYPELYDDELYHTEYFLGSELFVSPILHHKEEIMKRAIHRFYLPDGIWYDLYTGKKFIGNKKYVLFYSDETYPVFAKAGSIIPFGYNESINDVSTPALLEFNIFPGANNKYILYEDDGITNGYKNNSSFKTEINYKYLPDSYEISIKPCEGNLAKTFSTRNYRIILKNIKEIADVKAAINLKEIPFRKYADNNDLFLEFQNVDTNSVLNIKCSGKDIEYSNYRVLNDDISGIISDLLIDTELKNQIDEIIFSNMSIKKKRIAIRKLKNSGLQPRFINLFLKLLDYVMVVE